MFSCCSSADWVLFWPTEDETERNSKQAQDLLRCEIVNPLRRCVEASWNLTGANYSRRVYEGGLKSLLKGTGMFPRYGYVCASKTMALRRLLEAANHNMGFTNQEKGVWDIRCGSRFRHTLQVRKHVKWYDWGMLSCSAHQIPKSSSTSFSSSSVSSLSSRSGNVTVMLHFRQQ